MTSTLGKPPVTDDVIVNPTVPSWAGLSRTTLGTSQSVDREYVPELRWPLSVTTFERMSTDTQLSGLYRGTALPIRRYDWGIDPNGARPDIVEAVLRDFNLQLLTDVVARRTGAGQPVPRARNGFTLDRHWQDALKALRYGHQYFDLYGEIGDDGLWHPLKVTAIPPWTISQLPTLPNGDLAGLRQNNWLTGELIDPTRLVPYISEQDGGNWTGRSSYRSCYREWLLKDRLLRVDLRNHEKGGGVLLPIAPENATEQTRQQLAQLANAYAAGGGGSLPAGTEPVFIRASGSDVIASIDRHDAAMAREFLMMFMSLGTNSQSGNRALGGAFIDWFAIAQEATAVWIRDTFNVDVIQRYVEWNWGDQDYVPLLAFKRPEQDNPVRDLAASVDKPAGEPAAAALVRDGEILELAPVRTRIGGVHVDHETRHQILAAHDEYEQWARPRARRARAAIAAPEQALSLPDRPLRRKPYEHEVLAAVDFKQVDSNWQAAVARLVADWQRIRARQVTELAGHIVAADGDLAQLAQISATATGGDRIAEQLSEMARRGATDALEEARRQGVTPTAADLATLEDELAARSKALEQLLASALSQAAANRAVQLSGGSLAPAEVASEVTTYLNGLSDAYLTDQFGGALSAAQNGGRMAVFAENEPSHLYASELLDANTCAPCAEEDGTEFATAADAAAAYPSGGFKDCLGGPRCRGLVVAVYDESAPSTGGDQ